ncbi:MAG TPA: ABC transporter permease [Pirellulales bacterium]|jgi:ABC-type transport system involved in multi-copper enzyme maturation permease subunit|nr:ABC transporter permease [Pirellulales bacterium]
MVVTQFYNLADWLPKAIAYFFELGAALTLAAIVISFLVAAFRHGPLAGGDIVFRVATTAAVDLARTSPRRVWALARLAIQESLRRNVLVALAVFVVVLLFAGWFLDDTSPDPSTLYLTFVLTATTYLAWALGVFLSAFSLPSDFKTRTIYTVVTKPVRPGEIVLGRILGFTIIGSVLLAIMGVVSYVFAYRLLDHTHEVEVASLQPAGETAGGGLIGRTTSSHGHRHDVRLNADGTGKTDTKNGHSHTITARHEGDKTFYTLSSPEEMFVARVPVYGELRFKDRQGRGVDRGISVGKEWRYRSFVEGGSPAAAIWTFHGITREQFPQGLPIEMTIRVFRSHKGDINKGIAGTLIVRNPKTGRSSQEFPFIAKDQIVDYKKIGTDLLDASGQKLNLFDDLVDDGNVEVQINCLVRGQYFGMAMPDLYLRASDASFRVNFAKAFFGIWLTMLLVISFAVMFSTFLSGPVAMLATVAILVIGCFTENIYDLANGITQGGGPFESLVRIVKQQNMTLEMEEGLTKTVVQSADSAMLFLMKGVASLLPDFSKFDEAFVTHLAKGFDISSDTVGIWALRGVAYLCVAFVVGYFFLKTREVAK